MAGSNRSKQKLGWIKMRRTPDHTYSGAADKVVGLHSHGILKRVTLLRQHLLLLL
jgi:hypothetical protein